MDELLRKRIERQLEGLSDEKAYQVLDYIQFLRSRYGDWAVRTSPFQKIADSVEDTLRAGRVPVAAIKGTLGVFDAASRVMKGLADAGRAVVDEFQGAADTGSSGKPKAAPAPDTPPVETTEASDAPVEEQRRNGA